MTLRRLNCAVAALAATLAASPAHAMTLGKPLTVADLVRRSSDIVVGTVTRVSDGRFGNLATLEVELSVSETLRGSAQGPFKFRQLAGRAPERQEDGRRYLGLVPGMPSYKKGDAVLLFLGREGSLGLRTTVGLGQGRFDLKAGNALNGFGNEGLFRDVAVKAKDEKEAALLATSKGSVRTETLVGLVRRAVVEKWWDGGAQ